MACAIVCVAVAVGVSVGVDVAGMIVTFGGGRVGVGAGATQEHAPIHNINKRLANHFTN